MNKPIQPLIIRKESYRLWFEFYKLCINSTEMKVHKNLQDSNQFYSVWGDVKNIKFDDWWVSHQELFSEPVVKVLDDLSQRQTQDSLIIEVPLNQSTSSIVDSLKRFITIYQKPNYRKKKVRFTKSYQLTKGSEPKLKTIRSVLNIYRDVYLVNGKPKIPKLLPMVVNYYNGKKRMDIPSSLDIDSNDLENVLRNLGRWMKWGETIMLNVSNGEFPGKY